jgi:hypothetical protein
LDFEFQPNPESVERGAEELPQAKIESSHQIPLALVMQAEDSALAAISSHGG